MIDVGLKSGVKYLWEQDMFLDYTIKAGGEEFRVHKLVLVSVSAYFRTMLNGAMMESEKNEVEFTQFSADQISQLIEFIYTGSDSLLDDSDEGLLECAVYLQMPKVIKACTHSLLLGICVANCLDLLATFMDFSLHDAAAKASSYISRNAEKVMRRFRTREMSVHAIRIIMKAWQKSDWEMFIYLTTWFSADFENRKEHLEELMGQVKFSHMLPQEIEAVKDMGVYKNSDGAWKGQVCNALKGRSSYEDLPIYQKVIAEPEQTAVRGTKALYVMNTDPAAGGAAVVSNKDKWTSCWKSKGLEVSGTIPFVIEVNNFLVTCSEFSENQTLQIFDPRTLTWSQIANMPTPRDEFAMAYHDKHLYVLGGTEESAQKEKVLTDTIMMYSFEINTWSSTNIKLPVPVKNHAACVLNGAIYISGGEIATNNSTRLSNRLDRLTLSSKCWESKAPMATAKSHHPMFIMRKRGERICVIDEDLTLKYYDLRKDCWSHWDSTGTHIEFGMKFLKRVPWIPGKSRLLHSGNTLYLLNLQAKETNYDISSNSSYTTDSDDDEAQYACQKWEITNQYIRKRSVGDFPFSTGIACVLTVPQRPT